MRHFVSHLSPGRGPFPSKFPNFGLQNVPIHTSFLHKYSSPKRLRITSMLLYGDRNQQHRHHRTWQCMSVIYSQGSAARGFTAGSPGPAAKPRPLDSYTRSRKLTADRRDRLFQPLHRRPRSLARSSGQARPSGIARHKHEGSINAVKGRYGALMTQNITKMVRAGEVWSAAPQFRSQSE